MIHLPPVYRASWSLRKRWGIVAFGASYLGARLGIHTDVHPIVWFSLALCFLLMLGLSVTFRQRWFAGSGMGMIAILALTLAGGAGAEKNEYAHWMNTFSRGERVVLSGNVVDVLPHSDDRMQMIVQVERPLGWGLLKKAMRVRVVADVHELAALLHLFPADEAGHIRWPVRLYPFQPRGNPGEFDGIHWAIPRRFVATAYPNGGEIGFLPSPAPAGPFADPEQHDDFIACRYRKVLQQIAPPAFLKAQLRKLAARWRCHLARTPLPYVGGVAVSLLLGQKDLIDEHVRQWFQEAGMSHLLAVSGLHVGYVLMLFSPLVLRLPRAGAWLAQGVIAALFVALVNGPASAMRAGFMSIFAMGARAAGRSVDRWHVIGLVGTGLLLWEPFFAVDAGFQLSFLALFGILMAGIQRRSFLHGRQRGRWSAVLWGIGRSLVAGAYVQATTGPVVAGLFSTFPWVAPWINILAVPLAGMALALLLSGVVIYDFVPFVGGWVIAAGHHALYALVSLARWADGWGALEVAMPSSLTTFGWYGLLAGVVLIRHGLRRPGGVMWSRIGKHTALAGLLLLSSQHAFDALKASLNVVDVWILDVGQGDAVLIRSSRGTAMMIDGGGVPGAAARGGFDVGEQIVVPTLKRLGVKRLAYVINTHPHEDHLHGLVAVTRHRDVGAVFMSPAPSTGTAYRHFMAAAARRGVPVSRTYSGQIIHDGADFRVQVVASGGLEEWISERGRPNLNDRSIAMRMSHAGGNLLLLGDLEMRGQRRLLERAREGDIPLTGEVMMVPHHGAGSSFWPEMWREVSPDIALLSLGHNNYGHPAPELMAFLADDRIPVWRTDQHGAIRVRFWPWGYRVRTVR